jgi:hypothetical protein
MAMDKINPSVFLNAMLAAVHLLPSGQIQNHSEE